MRLLHLSSCSRSWWVVLLMIMPGAAAHAQSEGLLPYVLDSLVVERLLTWDIQGNVDQVKHYTVLPRPLTRQEQFFHAVDGRDGLVMDTVIVAEDWYTWDHAGNVLHIYRWERGRQGAYLFGPDHHIAIRRVEATIEGRAGEAQRVPFLMHNRGADTLELDWLRLPDNVLPERGQWSVVPNARSEAVVTVLLEAGTSTAHLLLGYPDGAIPISIRSRGYHVRTDDIVDGAGFSCPLTLMYYRTGGETMLELCDMHSGETVYRLPVHAEWSRLDLGVIGPGEVEFCILDHRASVRYCAPVIIER